ncbi:MAG: hypothetical protein WBC34_08565 [Thiofilum sp.]
MRELPEGLIHEVRPKVKTYAGVYRTPPTKSILPQAQADGYRVGQRVRHAKFGEGVITNAEGSGQSARVQVSFRKEGSKWLVLGYANLEII